VVILPILCGLVIGVEGTLMMAAGCRYAGACKVSTVEQFVPLAIGVVPFAGSLLLVGLLVHRRARSKSNASESTDVLFVGDSPVDDRRASVNSQ
jgi:hypothetical protein